MREPPGRGERPLRTTLHEGVARGITHHRPELKTQPPEVPETQKQMPRPEKSLRLSTKKCDMFSGEINRLKGRIERRITPQIEGRLEEATLLDTSRELPPADRFERPRKGATPPVRAGSGHDGRDQPA